VKRVLEYCKSMPLNKYLLGLHWFVKLIFLLGTLIFSWIVIAYVLPQVLPEARISNTEKFGIIVQNERWSGEIRVVGDIWALPGTTISIEPGTHIRVSRDSDKFNLHFTPWGLRSGLNTGEDWFGVRNGELFWDEGQKVQIRLSKVYGIGTPQQPIRIYSATTPQSPYDFNIFSIESGVLSHWEFSHYRRMLVGTDVTVRDSVFTNIAECAICVEYKSPTVINNVFRLTLRDHIFIVGGSPKISDNLFYQASEGGSAILIDPQYTGSPQIFNNDFELSFQPAIKVVTGDEEVGGEISFNNFSGNSLIEIPCDTKINFKNNQIRGAVKLAHSGNCVGKLVFGPNYWFTNDRDVILTEKFMDKETQFIVEIPHILNEPPKSGRR
jgi:hypothetical protein